MFHSFIASFIREEEGQDLVEYSLLLAFISLAVIAVMGTVRTSLTNLWTNVNTNLNTAAAEAAS